MTDQREIGNLVTDVGVSSAKILLKNNNSQFPASKLTPDQRRAYVEDALTKYSELRNVHYGATEAMEWTNIGIKLGSGLAAFAFPVLTIPAIIFAGTMDVVIDEGNERIEAWGETRATAQLAVLKDRLIQETGAVDFSDLQSSKLDEARSRILSSNAYLTDLKKRAEVAGEPAVVELATDFLIAALQATDEAALDGIIENTEDLGKIESEFSNFSEVVVSELSKVDAKLEEYGKTLGEISVDIRSLQEGMYEVNSRLGTIEARQDHVEDFMLARMSPEEKLTSLNSGFMKDRLSCPDGSSNCENVRLKDALVKQLQSEVKLKQHIEFAQTISKGINDLSNIAANLGIDNPEIGKALAIGSAAANAFIGFASGDVLGAISSISSVFGGRKDPSAERFKIMMNFLQEQFGIVNKKLDAIIENQTLIYEAIVGVGKLVDERLSIIDQRQQNLLFEQRRTSLGVRSLHWKDWRATYAVYRAAMERSSMSGEYLHIHPQTGLFHSSEALLGTGNRHLTSFRTSFDHLSPLIGSTNALRWFGSFADARLLMDELSSTPAGLSPSELEDISVWRPSLQRFLEDVFHPTVELVFDWSASEGIDLASLFSASTWPSHSFATTDSYISILKKEPFQCFEGLKRYAGTHDFLCQSEDSPQEIARSSLSTPVVGRSLIEISDWLSVLSQLADVYDQDSREFPQTLPDERSDGLGRPMVEAAIDILNQGIASYNVLYGKIAVDSAFAAIEQGGAKAGIAEKALASNEYLARNFAIKYLSARWDEEASIRGRDKLTLMAIYSNALAALESDQTQIPLQNLFGTDIDFYVKDRRTWCDVKFRDAGPLVSLPFPLPTEFVEKRLTLPNVYLRLIAKRDQMVDRLAGYVLVEGLPEDHLNAFVEIFISD